MQFVKGREYGALIDFVSGGIKFELPTLKNRYTQTYNINDIEEYFISALDKDKYNEIYKNRS